MSLLAPNAPLPPTVRVPFSIFKAPVKVFAPVNIALVLSLFFVIPPAPEIIPEKVTLGVLASLWLSERVPLEPIFMLLA